MKALVSLAFFFACGGSQVVATEGPAAQEQGALLSTASSTSESPALWIDVSGMTQVLLTEVERNELQEAARAALGTLVPEYRVLPFPRAELLSRLREGRNGNTGQACAMPPTLDEMKQLYDDVDRLYLTTHDIEGKLELRMVLQMAPSRSSERPFPILHKWHAPLDGETVPAIKASLAALTELALEPATGGGGMAGVYGMGGLMEKKPEEIPAISWTVADVEPPAALLACVREHAAGAAGSDLFGPRSIRSMDLIAGPKVCEPRFASGASHEALALHACFCSALDSSSWSERQRITIHVNASAPELAGAFGSQRAFLPDLRLMYRRTSPAAFGKASECLKPSKEAAAELMQEREALMNSKPTADEAKAKVRALAAKHPFLRQVIKATMTVDAAGTITGFAAADVDGMLGSCLESAFVGQVTACPASGNPESHEVEMLLH